MHCIVKTEIEHKEQHIKAITGQDIKAKMYV